MKDPIVFEATVRESVVAYGIGSMRGPITFLKIEHPTVEGVKFNGSPTIHGGDRIRVFVDPSRIGSRKNRPTRVEQLPSLLKDGLIAAGSVFRIDVLSPEGQCASVHITIDGWHTEKRELIDEFYR